MRSALPAAWPAASSNISPRAPGPSGCMPAGPRNRAFAPRCWRAAALSARAPCSRACTACSTALPTPPRATTTRWSAISARAGSPIRLPSSPIPAGPWRSPISIARGDWRRAASSPRTSPKSSARSRRERCTGCGSRSPTSSARATAMPRNSPCLICSRPASSTAASGSAPSPKARSPIRACSRSRQR